MHDTLSIERLEAMRGAPVYDVAGDKIGAVDEVFYDQDTQQPEWLGIGTGFFGTKRVLVPLSGAEQADDGLRVPYSKDQVKDSPDIDSDEISQDTEYRLAQHYGVAYSEERSDTGLPGQSSTGGRGKKGRGRREVVRSEEELRVGKEQVQSGRARLRKWVETEPVEMDVDLKRETARVTRERIDQPVSDAEIGEQEVEIGLREERPVVAKQTVAKERVGLETDVESERQTVSDELRKERVEIEGEDVSR